MTDPIDTRSAMTIGRPPRPGGPVGYNQRITHIDLLNYVAENAPVEISTNDGQRIVIANRDFIIADAGCAHILPRGEQKIILVSLIAITSARSLANGTELSAA